MDIENIDVEKVAKAIEADAGQALSGLRGSLEQAKRGEYGRVHTPEMIAEYKARGRPVGSVKAVVKRPTTLRLDESALSLWRASGKGWQTRAAALLVKNAPRA